MADDEQPKPHVKAHLDKRHVQWKDLSKRTKKAFNAFSADEITMLDELGAAFEEQNLATNVRVTAVH